MRWISVFAIVGGFAGGAGISYLFMQPAATTETRGAASPPIPDQGCPEGGKTGGRTSLADCKATTTPAAPYFIQISTPVEYVVASIVTEDGLIGATGQRVDVVIIWPETVWREAKTMPVPLILAEDVLVSAHRIVHEDDAKGRRLRNLVTLAMPEADAAKVELARTVGEVQIRVRPFRDR